jgi:hypothetical protein
MGFTKVWFVHNNTIWNSLLHITQRTSSQGKELHAVKHVVFCSSSEEMSIYNSSWDFCTTMFSSGLVSQQRLGSFQAFWLSFAWCLRPHLWIYCAAAIAMGFLGHLGFRLPRLLTGEGLWKFFWLSELRCLQHSYFPPSSGSCIYHIRVKRWESNQGLTTCVGALLNCT